MPRPTVLTPQIAAAVCEKLAEVGSLRRVCADPSMPSEDSVRRWYVQNADFAREYTRAKEAGIDALVDESLDIIDQAPPSLESGATDTGHVAWAKARTEYRRWLAERMMPKKYGNSQKLEHTGADGGPIQSRSIIVATGVPDGSIDISDLV